MYSWTNFFLHSLQIETQRSNHCKRTARMESIQLWVGRSLLQIWRATVRYVSSAPPVLGARRLQRFFLEKKPLLPYHWQLGYDRTKQKVSLKLSSYFFHDSYFLSSKPFTRLKFTVFYFFSGSPLVKHLLDSNSWIEEWPSKYPACNRYGSGSSKKIALKKICKSLQDFVNIIWILLFLFSFVV